ncbi:hypothetical protein FQA39_LY12059 [Lamprigera yunnana]|nr:hypothetical protein FQA39_LY12059 [Lamprigera yunnana]
MKKVVLCMHLLYISIFAENDYSVDFEKIDIVSFNPDLVEDLVITLFQFNDTSQGVNSSGTLKKDLGMDIKVNMDVSKLQDNNEYKQLTAVTDADMCELINKNQFGLKDILSYGNFTVCPWKQAHYALHNAMIDVHKLPSNAPPGKYLMNTKFLAGTTELVHVRFLGSVVKK